MSDFRNVHDICEDCDHYVTVDDKPACDLVGKWVEQGGVRKWVVSCCMLRRMWADPHARCAQTIVPPPASDGVDKWAGALCIPLNVADVRTRGVAMKNPGYEWLAERVKTCLRCEHHRGTRPWRCAKAGGPIDLKEQVFRCPEGRFPSFKDQTRA